jgi:hypothetical protein
MATGLYHANIHGDRLILLYADRWATQRRMDRTDDRRQLGCRQHVVGHIGGNDA